MHGTFVDLYCVMECYAIMITVAQLSLVARFS
jgi:hypothetical protein